MDNASLMKKTVQQVDGSSGRAWAAVRKWLALPAVGQVLSVLFGLLFLFQCMIMPLVGKAAMQGSRSPGAGPAEHAAQNVVFFLVMLVLTLLAGAVALYSKGLRRAEDGSPFPVATAGLLGVTVALGLAFVAGWLKV